MKISDIDVDLVEYCGSDLTVVNAARVSFDKQSFWKEYEPDNLFEKDAKLINYLAKHKHFSPFNHCFISTRIKAPIFVARQLVKHEYLPWNEVSRRYVDSEPEFYIPESFRLKADNKKQGSMGEMPNSGDWLEEIYRNSSACLSCYTYAIKNGMCPEQARMFLPHNLMTEWIWSGTLGAFAKMLGLRMSLDTQFETREVADKIYDIIQPLFPVSLKALLENK